MKKWLVLGMVVSLWLGSVVAVSRAQGTRETEMLVSQIKEILNANSVLGTPLEIEGTKIIPIASILFGFGSGTGSSQEETGTGGGGGGTVMPVGFLIIKDGEIRVIEAQKSMLAEIVRSLVPVLLQSMQSQREMRENQEELPPGAPAPEPPAQSQSSQ